MILFSAAAAAAAATAVRRQRQRRGGPPAAHAPDLSRLLWGEIGAFIRTLGARLGNRPVR